MPHLRRGAVSAHAPCHVTLRLRPGIPSLRTRRFVAAFEESVRALRARGDFRLVHYSIQSNHLHAIVEAEHPAALGRGMMALGTRVALLVQRVFRVRGSVLPERYHLRKLRRPREVRNAIAYVLLNARKHLAERVGLAAARRTAARPDPASSARWFGGWRGGALQDVTAASTTVPPPVAAARSWLLCVGWLRHGRIDPGEVPGLVARP